MVSLLGQGNYGDSVAFNMILTKENSYSEQSKGIAVETSKGRAIENFQVGEISIFEQSQFKNYSVARFPSVKFRNGPTAMYNCHGMSFASKRTNIDSSPDIRHIIEDDRYLRVDIDKVMPGDVVLYISNYDNDIQHSATVIECKKKENDLHSITVVSKWGKFREAIHNLNDCPYRNCNKLYYRVHYELQEVS